MSLLVGVDYMVTRVNGGDMVWYLEYLALEDKLKELQSRLDKIQVIVDSGYCDPYDLRKILDVV